MNFIRPRWRRRTITLFYSVDIFSPSHFVERGLLYVSRWGTKADRPSISKRRAITVFLQIFDFLQKFGGPVCAVQHFSRFFQVLWLPTQVMQSNTKLFSPPSPTLVLRYYHHSSYFYSSSFKKGETSAAPLACAQR